MLPWGAGSGWKPFRGAEGMADDMRAPIRGLMGCGLVNVPLCGGVRLPAVHMHVSCLSL